MPDEKKKYKNLAVYAVVMALAVIILIIFAAMADNREQKFETQLDEKENINIAIQNEIVELKDENYKLNNSVEKLTAELEQKDKDLAFYTVMAEAWELYGTDRSADAADKLAEISEDNLTEEQRLKYQTLKELLTSVKN